MVKKQQLIADQFTYHSEQTQYSWPLEDGQLSLTLSADRECQLYLVNSFKEEAVYPLFVGTTFARDIEISGYDLLVLKTKAKTAQVAMRVINTTDEDLDPLDYTPVKVGEPLEVQERTMMQIVLDQKLRELGIDPQQHNYDESDEKEDDLDFFDDEEFTGATAYGEIMPDEMQQLTEEFPTDNPQPEDSSNSDDEATSDTSSENSEKAD